MRKALMSPSASAMNHAWRRLVAVCRILRGATAAATGKHRGRGARATHLPPQLLPQRLDARFKAQRLAQQSAEQQRKDQQQSVLRLQRHLGAERDGEEPGGLKLNLPEALRKGAMQPEPQRAAEHNCAHVDQRAKREIFHRGEDATRRNEVRECTSAQIHSNPSRLALHRRQSALLSAQLIADLRERGVLVHSCTGHYIRGSASRRQRGQGRK
jgi:hypothetical protein